MIRNKSKTYLLPLLSEFIDFDRKFYKFIKGTFINFDDEECENCIGILHDFSFKNPAFTAYEHKLIKNELFVKMIDIDNYVFYVFKFPEVYMHEYNCFKKGQYSRFGVDAKELILEFFNHVYKGNINATPFLLKVNQILFKDKKLKRQLEQELHVTLDDDAELSDTPDMESEFFEIKNIQKPEETKK